MTETVTKQDLARDLFEQFDALRWRYGAVTGPCAREVVTAVLESIADRLEAGERIELRGFGVLESVERGATTARDPRTGEPVEVPARVVPRWRPGAPLREAVEDANDVSAD